MQPKPSWQPRKASRHQHRRSARDASASARELSPRPAISTPRPPISMSTCSIRAYLRLFKARGGTLVCDAESHAMKRQNGVWRVSTAKANLLPRPSSMQQALGPTRLQSWPARGPSVSFPNGAVSPLSRLRKAMVSWPGRSHWRHGRDMVLQAIGRQAANVSRRCDTGRSP